MLDDSQIVECVFIIVGGIVIITKMLCAPISSDDVDTKEENNE